MKDLEAEAIKTGGRHPRWAGATWFCIVLAIVPWLALPLVQALAVESAIARTMSANPGLTVQASGIDGIDAFNAFADRVDKRVAAHLGSNVVQTTAFAALGPLHLSEIGGLATSPSVSRLQITPSYVDHLGTHVEVLAGDLPAEGLGGGDAAVTMPQSGADQAGLRMSDHFCMDTGGAGRQSRWCARVIGLWRPLDDRDPVWGGTPPQLRLMLSRHDFFELAGLLSQRPVVAGVRYQANPYVVDRDRAGEVPDQVRALRQDLAGQPGVQLDTTLDRTGDRLLGQLASTSRLLRVLTAVIVLVTLSLVAVVVRCFLDRTGSELAARGPAEFRGAGRVSLLALLALPVGVACGLLPTAAMLISVDGVSLTWLHPTDLQEVAVKMFVGLCALFTTLAVVSARTRGEVGTAEPMAPTSRPIRWRLRAGRGLALAGLGGLVMLAGHFAMSGPPGAGTLGLVVWLLPAAAVALLGGAALYLVPLTAGLPFLRHSDLAGTLASLQFERRPEQHAGLALFLFLAVAAATFAAGSVVEVAAGTQPPALHYGLECGLLLSLLIVLVSLPIGFGLHFLATGRRRLVEYASLFAHHLPARTVGESLGAEQAVILWPSLVAGGVVGIALVLTVTPGLAVSAPLAAAAVAVVAAAAAVLVLLAGRPARRLEDAGW